VEQKDKEIGISLGVKDYITKPFAFKDLKTIIDLHLK
jgi:DNA-binding response OmpR family regulator